MKRLSAAFWTILITLTMGVGTISTPSSLARSLSLSSGPFDFGNQTFILDHEALHLTNGSYRSLDGQHVARLTDRTVNEALSRAAAILIDSPSGSGAFFYVVGAARLTGMERYSTPTFLGDRIKIEAVQVSGEMVTIHYLDHPANTPLGFLPTRPVTVTYTIEDDGSLH